MIFILSTLFFSNAIGQTYNLPAVISPSPQSTALTRYGDYPMASYTGLTDITIPLQTVIGRKLSLPITMSFHASGRMANETNGILGMRWTLNCGGLVTRNMKGEPDEWDALTPFDVAVAQSNSNGPSFDILYSACPDGKIKGYQNPYNGTGTPIYDSEYDIFNYVLPNGKQGHFILKNVNGAKVAMAIPYEPIRIETFNGLFAFGGGYLIQHIKITDVDGIQYIFGQLDASNANAVETSDEWHHPFYGTDNSTIPTAWYLTKIISSDATDEISLSYTSRYASSANASQSANIGDELRDNSTYLNGGRADTYEDGLVSRYVQWHFERDFDPIVKYNANTYTTPTLSGIQFNGGSVSLTYTTGTELLSQILVKRGTTPYKKNSFNFSRHPGEGGLYYLDGLSNYGENQNTAVETYGFNYYEPNNNSQFHGAFYDAKYKDWWGYYQVSNQLLPAQSIPITKVPGGNFEPVYQDIGFDNGYVTRDGDEGSKKIGMLRTITYPTGGQTEFIYEGNKYDYSPYYQPGQNAALLEGPGLRIKEIISKPISGKDIHKVYTYGQYEDGRGFINEYLRPGSIPYRKLTATQGVDMYFWVADGLNPLITPQAGFRSRNYYSDPYLGFDMAGSLVKYDAVSEYYVEGGISQQKTQTQYSWGDYEYVQDFTVTDHFGPVYETRKFSDPQNICLSPVMTSKTFYNYSNNQFNPARKETYGYAFQQKDEAWDMPTYLHTNVVYARAYNSNGGISATDNYNASKDYHNNSCSVYGYGFRKYKSGSQLLYNTTIEEYTPNGTIVTQKDIDYENTYQFVKSEATTNSKKETIKTTYMYPHDFINQQPYTDMVNEKHMLSPVIVQTKYKTAGGTDNFLYSTKTNYNFWNKNSGWGVNNSTSIIVPQSIDSKILANPSETRIQFNIHDGFGNILEQQKANDVKEVYLWGYNSQYPVAKVLGSDYNTVSAVVSQAAIDANIGNDANLRNVLNALRTDGRTSKALVTTYTYAPLIGITSETDPSGKTTFYEYDNFNRLKLIRDKDDNILKSFQYKYQEQQ